MNYTIMTTIDKGRGTQHDAAIAEVPKGVPDAWYRAETIARTLSRHDGGCYYVVDQGVLCTSFTGGQRDDGSKP